MNDLKRVSEILDGDQHTVFVPDDAPAAATTYQGRAVEDAALREFVTASAKALCIYGEQGRGKSEIVRQACNQKWFRAQYNYVITIDCTDRTPDDDIEPALREEILKVLPKEKVKNTSRHTDILCPIVAEDTQNSYLFIFDNMEDLKNPAEVFGVLDLFKNAAHIAVICITSHSDANLDSQFLSRGFRFLKVEDLSMDDCVALLDKWESVRKNADERMRKGDITIKKAIVADYAEYKPRMLRLLDGLFQLLPEKDLASFRAYVDDLLKNIESGDEKLLTILQSITEKLDSDDQKVLYCMAVTACPVLQPDIADFLDRNKGKCPQILEKLYRYKLIRRSKRCSYSGSERDSEPGSWVVPDDLVRVLELAEAQHLRNRTLIKKYYKPSCKLLFNMIDKVIEPEEEDESTPSDSFTKGYKFENEHFSTYAKRLVHNANVIDVRYARVLFVYFFFSGMDWVGEIEDHASLVALLDVWNRSEAHRTKESIGDDITKFFVAFPKEVYLDGYPHSELMKRWQEATVHIKAIDEEWKTIEEEFDEWLTETIKTKINPMEGNQPQEIKDTTNAYIASYLGSCLIESHINPKSVEEGFRYYDRAIATYTGDEINAEAEYDAAYYRVEKARYYLLYQKYSDNIEKYGDFIKILKPTWDPSGAKRDASDVEVEARILDVLSEFLYSRNMFKEAILCGYYACVQAYLYLYCQPLLADNYSSLFYRMIGNRLLTRISGLKPQEQKDSAGWIREEYDQVKSIMDKSILDKTGLAELISFPVSPPDPQKMHELLSSAMPQLKPGMPENEDSPLYGIIIPKNTVAEADRDKSNPNKKAVNKMMKQKGKGSINTLIDEKIVEFGAAAEKARSIN